MSDIDLNSEISSPNIDEVDNKFKKTKLLRDVFIALFVVFLVAFIIMLIIYFQFPRTQTSSRTPIIGSLRSNKVDLRINDTNNLNGVIIEPSLLPLELNRNADTNILNIKGTFNDYTFDSYYYITNGHLELYTKFNSLGQEKLLSQLTTVLGANNITTVARTANGQTSVSNSPNQLPQMLYGNIPVSLGYLATNNYYINANSTNVNGVNLRGNFEYNTSVAGYDLNYGVYQNDTLLTNVNNNSINGKISNYVIKSNI